MECRLATSRTLDGGQHRTAPVVMTASPVKQSRADDAERATTPPALA